MKPLLYKNKTIGFLYKREGELIFEKRVIPKKHKVRKFNAYGIQENVFQNELAGNKGRIEIKEKNKTGRILTASISTWTDKGFVRNLGSGIQRFLSIDAMEISCKDQPKLL